MSDEEDSDDVDVNLPLWTDDVPDRIDQYLEELEGLNPFNFESECYMGMADNREGLKTDFIEKMDEMEGGTFKRGIMYAGLLARFEDLYFSPDTGSDESGLLDSNNPDLKFYAGPDGKDGGIDGILIDDASERILTVQAKSGRKTKYGEIAELFEDSKQKIINNNQSGTSGVAVWWKDRWSKCHELVADDNYTVEPIFVAKTFADGILEGLTPDSDTDLTIEKYKNFLEKDEFNEIAEEIRYASSHKMPRITLEFKGSFQEAAEIDGEPVTLWFGLVPLIDLVDHFHKPEVKPYLFASNVRYGLRKTDFKNTLERTLTKNEKEFVLLNNGISAVASGNVVAGTAASSNSFQDFLVINGAQTISTVESLVYSRSGGGITVNDALVPIRITKINTTDPEKKSGIITKLTVANNRQRPIANSDLFTNKKFHISLKYKLKKYAIFYATKGEEFKGTLGHLSLASRKKYYFDKSPLTVVNDMGNNLLGESKPKPKQNKANQLHMLKFTPYILAFSGKPISARTDKQKHYADKESHQNLWCHYENSIANGGSDDHEIGDKEFNHKLFCFSTGAFLQNCIMNKKLIFNTKMKKDLADPAKLNLSESEMDKQAPLQINNARWFLMHAFRKKFSSEIDNIIEHSIPSAIGSEINTFFSDSSRGDFMVKMIEELVKVMLNAIDKASSGTSGYEGVAMTRFFQTFFQSQKCLDDFETALGI